MSLAVLEATLLLAAEHFAGKLIGDKHIGWEELTIGSAICLDTGVSAWLKVRRTPFAANIPVLWSGEQEAQALADLPKPRVLSIHRWRKTGYRFQAVLMECAAYPAASGGPLLDENAGLPSTGWFHDLSDALRKLSGSSTPRLAWRMLHAAAVLRDTYGFALERVVDRVQPIHADLHWANVTLPGLAILDWEGWGLGPAGLDEAMLLAASAANPAAFAKVGTFFSAALCAPQGAACRLYAATDLLRHVDAGLLSSAAQPLLVQMAEDAARDLSIRKH